MPEPLARVESYDDLVHALRARVDQLGISQETLAALARLQGYSSDVLKPQGNMRSLGRMSFGCVLGALGLKIVLVEDRDALAKVRERLIERDNAQARRKNTWPPSIKGPADNVFVVLGRAGGIARAAKLSANQRVKISRKAIRARRSKARAGKLGARERWQER
jgi:hypothetical protein